MTNTQFALQRKFYNNFLRIVMILSITLVAIFIVLFVGFILYKGIPQINWKLISTKPSYISESIGILPDILNTLYVIFTTLCVVLPLGLGSAIYLNEYARNKKIIAAIEYTSECLSGIPSIIFGLVGMLFFCQFLGMKTSLLAGSMTLVIMNLPIMMRTIQESLKTVPQSYREGAFGLGAGKWYVIKTVVIPQCIDGIITGSILSVGKILGESAALLFTAGFAHALNNFVEALTASGSTLTVALYVYAKEQGEFEISFAIAAILLIMTFIINTLATVLGKRMKRNKH